MYLRHTRGGAGEHNRAASQDTKQRVSERARERVVERTEATDKRRSNGRVVRRLLVSRSSRACGLGFGRVARYISFIRAANNNNNQAAAVSSKQASGSWYADEMG